MKLKLDENLGSRGASRLAAAGHDVLTVIDQGMTSASDLSLISACQTEQRCLVTLDLDFANPVRFDPASYTGIAVLRSGGPTSAAELDALVTTLIDALSENTVEGKLWIVEIGRFREYVPDSG